MKKAITIIALILIFAMAVILLLDKDKKTTSNKMQITVSTFALYDVCTRLLQNLADVNMLIPFGQDIHTYEMTPQERIRIEKSKFFIYSGAGLEPWTKSFQSNPNVIDMSKYVKLIKVDESHGHLHEHQAYDPHYWLDIDNMIIITKKLRDIFVKEFPKDEAKRIVQRSFHYIKMLENLDNLYKKRLSTCNNDSIIVSHNAFTYLSKRYGFNIISLSGLSPDAKPSAKDLARLSDIIAEKGISVIFAEPFVSDSLIQSLANETGSMVDVLQPLANISKLESLEMRDYELMMNLNLKKLHHALDCR
jgi:zinc transport system substrate-binding protein